MREKETYKTYTEEELFNLPTVFRHGLFQDQVVLISGAAGGVGTACSVLFGRLGATIVACSRTQEKLCRLQTNLAKLNIPCHTQAMTIRDPHQVADLMERVWEKYGKLDVLINNAGGQFAKPALEITPKGWNAVIDTNLNGTWYMMQAAAKRWSDRGQPGCMVNMATLTGHAFVGIPHTAASRAGEINLSKTLSVEWAPYNIRINCIAIGKVDSPGLATYPQQAWDSFDHNPMRRLGSVQDIAEAAVYLAGPSGSFITGAVLTVDGGEDVWGEYWALGKPEYFKVQE
jgi:citronellol/citronellal dehydrogenase